MKNSIKFMNRLISVCLLLSVLAACGREHPLKEDWYYLDKTSTEWVHADTLLEGFTMIDDNGITHHYVFKGSSHEFDVGWSNFLTITTHTGYTETSSYGYQSNYGLPFRVSLRAGRPPDGDMLRLTLGETDFTYNLKLNVLDRIHVSFGSLHQTAIAQENEIYEPMLSYCEMMDSLSVNGVLYQNVLHFVLNDFKEYWNRYQINEIFLSKGNGLIKYLMFNGVATSRVPN